MSAPTLIYDPNAGGNVPANLDFAADGLTVFNAQGRKLQHWPYAEIVHAYPPDAGKDAILAHAGRLEIQLQVRDDVVYAAIRARAPQLRPLRRGWKSFWTVMRGMPEQAQFGIIALIALVAFTVYSFVKGLFH
jgi:hypothetical protein